MSPASRHMLSVVQNLSWNAATFRRGDLPYREAQWVQVERVWRAWGHGEIAERFLADLVERRMVEVREETCGRLVRPTSPLGWGTFAGTSELTHV